MGWRSCFERGWLILLLAVALAMAAPAAWSQSDRSEMPGMNMGPPASAPVPMKMGANASAGMLLRQSSGTDVQPQSWAMPQLMQDVGRWRLMWMGQAFVTDVQQWGVPQGVVAPVPAGAPVNEQEPTGLDKLYSTNWGMLAAVHPLGPGAVMLRSMLSLEPATISDRRYPELFQTGETAYGVSIVNGQHPHNFVMELAGEVAEPMHKDIRGYIYYGFVGDPALGPTAYPHRASAAEFPQAALGHHYEDSTHIADNVATVGVEDGWVRLEASGFCGREPGENRWTISVCGMDSWSARMAISPVIAGVRGLTAQVSTGRLTHPEAASSGDIERTTASAEYVTQGGWASSLIWGRNYKTDGRYAVNALTAETLVPVKHNNLVTGRYEWSQRDELFDYDPALQQELAADGHRWFDVSAFTEGYTRVLGNWHNAELGAGANLTEYYVPDALRPYYGKYPMGVSVYVRARLKAMRAMQMN
jgi:hypothetical protein